MNRHGGGSRFERPHSEQLVDLHVYIVPQDLWQDRLNSALNQIVDDTVSGGFVRVLPETTIYGLREEVERQIGFDIIPREYVFLKSVGRCLTRVKPKQELQMKVKHFLPPHSYSPEIFLLEPTTQMRGLMSEDSSSYNSSPGRRAIEHEPGARDRYYNKGQGQNGDISVWDREEFLKRKQQEEEEKLRREEEARRRAEESWRQDEEARRAEEAQRADEARRMQEEEERRRQEEERRRQAEEEERRREEERRKEEEERKRKDFPSPPPLTVTAYLDPAEEKKQILAELEETRQRRREIEARREDLVRRAKQLQAKTQSRRNQARDMWKKKYFEEKKKTPPLEDKCNRLRQELELLHRKIVGQMEGGKGRESFKIEKGDNKPSAASNLRIQATKLHHEIEELQRRVDDAKMKLTGEVKLRNQAEAELRALRAELTQKKINVTLTRSQKLAALGSSQDVYTPRPAAISPRS